MRRNPRQFSREKMGTNTVLAFPRLTLRRSCDSSCMIRTPIGRFLGTSGRKEFSRKTPLMTAGNSPFCGHSPTCFATPIMEIL